MAQQLITALIEKDQRKSPQERNYKSREVIEDAIFTVTLAGVMHDIGHGPFSHSFDNTIVKGTLIDYYDDDKQLQKNVEWSH